MATEHWTTASETLLEIVQAPRFGLLSDFDGTLCHFRPYPEMPHMTERNEKLIIELAKASTVVALISGRAALELESMVKLPGIVYVGNHGLEELRDGKVIVVEAAREWEERMNGFYHELGEPTIPGVRHQFKRVTMSVTYRYADQPEKVRLQLLEKLQAINEKYGFSLSEGRTIWEVKPPIEANKGTAIAVLVKEHKLDSAIYLGDDFTDVSAFESIKALRAAGRIKGLTVAVLGETDVPLVRETADVIANSVEDVEELFTFLLEKRLAISSISDQHEQPQPSAIRHPER